MMRAILLARATVTSIFGLCANICASHDPFGAPRRLACCTTALAPMISRRRIWSCPGFVDTGLFGFEESTMGKTRAAYPPEFRRQMVELVRAGRSPEELAREFEPTAPSIRNWLAQSERNAGRGDACLASSGRARGVATVKQEVSEEELKRLHEAGVRGVRFNFVKRLVDFTPKDELIEIAGRIAGL